MSVAVPERAEHKGSSERGESDRDSTPLRRGITGKLLFFFVLGDVLGAGIYALVGEIAGEVGGAVWVPMLVALGLALLTAGSYAELVTKYPKAGGSAVFAERAYRSDLVAFLVGYCMLAAGVVSAAGLSIAFSGDYLKTFIDVPTQVGAVVFLVAIAALNARGIRESMGANVVMTCIELTGLLIVIAAAATLLADGGGEPGRVLEFTENETMISATFAGTLLAFYSFVGFETTANVAEEIKDPSRVYPRALFGALIAAGIMYALIGMAATTSLPVPDLAESTGPLLSVVEVSPLNVPDRVFSLIALVAVANGALLTMIMSSRLTYGMSVQGNLPTVFSRVLSVRKTPIVAIVVTTAVAIGLTFLGDLATLAETVVLLLLFVFLSTNIAVLVLKKDEVEHRHFRVWSFVPVLAVISCLVLLTQQSTGVWIRGLALVAVGALLFAFMKWRGTGKVETE